ncbi:Alkaline phosphatase [Balamuthia mandrillaris]
MLMRKASKRKEREEEEEAEWSLKENEEEQEEEEVDEDEEEEQEAKPRKKKKRKSKTKQTGRSGEEKERARALRERAKLHKESVERACAANKTANRRGRVSCNKQPHYRAPKHVDKRWPNKEGFMNISVCSGSRRPYDQLSPMKLGPVDYVFEQERLRATNVENLWQFSKVWPGEVDGRTGDPLPSWFARRKAGWADRKAHRWVRKGPKDSPNRNAPLYSFWKGRRLGYVPARKAVYCPEYAKLVVRTQAFRQLQGLLEDGYNVQILGYDGFDFEAEGMSLRECLEDPRRPFGHELVLVALLRGERVWEEEEEEGGQAKEETNGGGGKGTEKEEQQQQEEGGGSSSGS